MDKSGGPAFPLAVAPGVIGAGCGPHAEWGITVRDYFAAQALAGYFSAAANPAAMSMPQPTEAAEFAYRVADAMLEVRAKP